MVNQWIKSFPDKSRGGVGQFLQFIRFMNNQRLHRAFRQCAISVLIIHSADFMASKEKHLDFSRR